MEAAANNGAKGVIIAVESNERVECLPRCQILAIAIIRDDASSIIKKLWINRQIMLNFTEYASFIKEVENMRTSLRINNLAYPRLDADILASGYHLFTTHLSRNTDKYGYYSSPSAATAYVADMVVLLLQLYPRKSLDPIVVKMLLRGLSYLITLSFGDTLDSGVSGCRHA
jgi:hypothetical protein